MAKSPVMARPVGVGGGGRGGSGADDWEAIILEMCF